MTTHSLYYLKPVGQSERSVLSAEPLNWPPAKRFHYLSVLLSAYRCRVCCSRSFNQLLRPFLETHASAKILATHLDQFRANWFRWSTLEGEGGGKIQAKRTEISANGENVWRHAARLAHFLFPGGSSHHSPNTQKGLFLSSPGKQKWQFISHGDGGGVLSPRDGLCNPWRWPL